MATKKTASASSTSTSSKSKRGARKKRSAAEANPFPDLPVAPRSSTDAKDELYAQLMAVLPTAVDKLSSMFLQKAMLDNTRTKRQQRFDSAADALATAAEWSGKHPDPELLEKFRLRFEAARAEMQQDLAVPGADVSTAPPAPDPAPTTAAATDTSTN